MHMLKGYDRLLVLLSDLQSSRICVTLASRQAKWTVVLGLEWTATWQNKLAPSPVSTLSPWIFPTPCPPHTTSLLLSLENKFLWHTSSAIKFCSCSLIEWEVRLSVWSTAGIKSIWILFASNINSLSLSYYSWPRP